MKSMTGYGKETVEYSGKRIIIEIKSLNSKQLDLNTKIPIYYKEKEILIRNQIRDFLERGKCDLFIWMENGEQGKVNEINSSVISDYFSQIKVLTSKIGIQTDDSTILSIIMKFPDALKTGFEELSEAEWNIVSEGIKKVLVQVDNFRKQEGKALAKDIVSRIELIKSLSSQTDTFENSRVIKIKEKIEKHIAEFLSSTDIDKSRIEQEMIFYIEKLDITEEKVRLSNHCDYFIKTLNEEENSGKKLGFISQEIGREINTIGSKANDLDIQKLVVQMKDELEKIKEQLMNVL